MGSSAASFSQRGASTDTTIWCAGTRSPDPTRRPRRAVLVNTELRQGAGSPAVQPPVSESRCERRLDEINLFARLRLRARAGIASERGNIGRHRVSARILPAKPSRWCAGIKCEVVNWAARVSVLILDAPTAATKIAWPPTAFQCPGIDGGAIPHFVEGTRAACCRDAMVFFPVLPVGRRSIHSTVIERSLDCVFAI